MNHDNTELIRESIKVVRKDPDSTELELPLTVNLSEVCKFLDHHIAEMNNIQLKIPKSLDCGMFMIHVEAVRALLLEKHRQIVQTALMEHSAYSKEICKYLDSELRKIILKIATRPSNIEELIELEEYMAAVGNILQPLQTGISEMLANHNLLDNYQFKIDAEHFSLIWSVVAYPEKILRRCKETAEQNLFVKRRFKEDMQGRQSEFLKEMDSLETSIRGLESYHDLDDVHEIAKIVREVNGRMNDALEKVCLDKFTINYLLIYDARHANSTLTKAFSMPT